MALFEFIDTTKITTGMRSFLTGVDAIQIECSEGLIEDEELCREYVIVNIEYSNDRRRL